MLLLWGTLGYSAVVATNSLFGRVLLLLIGSGVTLRLLCFKTLTPEMLS